MSKTRIFLLSILFLAITSSMAKAEEVINIAVARFTSATSEATRQQASSATDVFTENLMRTPGIAVVGGVRVDELLRNPSTAAESGRKLGCQYVILGSVAQLKETVTKTKTKKRTVTSGNAEATLHIQVISTATGETIYSELSTGKSSSNEDDGNTEYLRPGLSAMKQEALSSASKAACKKIIVAMTDASVRVISNESGSIILNKGASQGVSIGDIYVVYGEGKDIRDIDGTFLGREAVNTALLEVYEVQAKYSRAVMTSNFVKTGVQVGDKARQISREEAEALNRQPHQQAPALRTGGNSYTVLNEDTLSEPEYLKAPPLVLERMSTKPEKVIAGYALTEKEKRARISAHKKLLVAPKDRNTYDGYIALTKSYTGDYLASYQAGATAIALGMRPEAYSWFKRALRINPNYKPAQEGLEKSRTQDQEE